MKRIILAVILCVGLGLSFVYSQTIKFELPVQKGKILYLAAYKGLRRDTLFSGQIDAKGNLVFIPSKDKPLSAGVVSLTIKPDINFDFIYSSAENSTIHCEGEYIYAQNTKYTGSPENDFIETRFSEQRQRREKMMFCEQGMRLYTENEKLYSLLKEENSNLEQQQTAYEMMLQEKSANLYSARLLELQNLLNNYIGRLGTTKNTTEYTRIREYTLKELDVETLYRSGMWFSIFNGMLEMYYKDSPFYGQFGNDIATLLQKTQSQEVFLELADNAATICNQFGWNADEAALSKYLVLSNKLINPKGKLKQMLMVNKLQPGMPAPEIAETDSTLIDFAGKKKTLVIFYESGCGNCENAMNQLVGNYSALKEKGIEVVSIAADMDTTVFKNTSLNFPWQKKLCDFKGYESDNFKNYAIIGTPTIYRIDENGIIQGKYAGWEEIAKELF